MTNQKKMLLDLTGQQVTIFSVEKQFTGMLDASQTVSNRTDSLQIDAKDILDVKIIGNTNIIVVNQSYPF